ncbi:MAG TPA: UDP-N-acetylmuramoyl-L-alanine--D-glutamate ligase [Elusimicrobiales bacterium]|nr:UDP-N-acetylmuramoyl-L-alanine--D-glutamate ligase [Elusimicrobiales bacterium]
MFIPEKFTAKKALVIGAGKSGVACANLLAARGFKVLLTEEKAAGAVRENLKGLSRLVRAETGGHTAAAFGCAFAVKSPGLPHTNPLIAALKKKKIPVVSEVETALAFAGGAPLLAVTGTNGKTTTTMLLGEIMRLALKGKKGRALVCGNVGIPAARIAADARAGDAIVMEISSYQLEDSSFIKPAVACLLNITPDHLDHHGGMAAYIKAKRRVFEFQSPEDACVFNAADPLCVKLAKKCRAKKLFFSAAGGKNLNARVFEGELHFTTGKTSFSARPPALPGAHNLENAMCAGLMALAAGAAPAHIRKAFKAFKGVEHRLEPAGAVRGIKFINDSKATNVDSTLVALKAMPPKRAAWLIMGGTDKGTPYAPLLPLIRERVKAVLTIGSGAARIERELAGACPVITALTMETACRNILKMAAAGETALFSPACASFDQFKDFEDRGRKFKAFVKKLK